MASLRLLKRRVPRLRSRIWGPDTQCQAPGQTRRVVKAQQRLIALTFLLLVTALIGAPFVPRVSAEGQADQTPVTAAASRSSAYLSQPVSLGLYRPAFPNDLRVVDSYEEAAPGKISIVHWFAYWGGWKREFSRKDIETVAARGAMPMISWEPWAGTPSDPHWSLREAILSGRNDAYIASWAQGMAAYGRPVMLRFAHEMHHQTYPWAIGINGNTAKEYVAAWHHIRAIFDAHGASNVQWVWNPNTLGDTTADGYEALYRSLYPGDYYVDWTAIDIYNTGPHLDWGAPYWRSFEQIVRPPYTAIARITHKPMVLAEVGSTEVGGSKSAWIADALSPQTLGSFPLIRAIVWFDIDKEQNWALQSSNASYASWRAAAQEAHFRTALPASGSGQPALFVPSLAKFSVSAR